MSYGSKPDVQKFGKRSWRDIFAAEVKPQMSASECIVQCSRNGKTRQLRPEDYRASPVLSESHFHRTTVQARHGESTTVVTGKVVLGEQVVVQRHTPLDVACPGAEVIDEVRVEFLNPDGSHYDFMGREHSLALALSVPQDPVRSLLP